MTTYTEARTVEDAIEAMARGAKPIAGGTDLVVGARQGKAPLPESLVGIHRVPGLDTIEATGDGLRIGALVTHDVLCRDPAIAADFTALADGSAVVGSNATRANGTIGGNVMNASPAMDTGAGLLCFDATATLQSSAGTRIVDLEELWTGPRTTSARDDELLTSIHVTRSPTESGSAYVRLQYRRHMEIAVVGAAAALTLGDGGTVLRARVAIAALSPVIVRVPAAEGALEGAPPTDAAVAAAAEAAANEARPISDVRGSADYRTAMAAVITERAIRAAVARAQGASVAIPASDSTFGS